MQLETKYFGPVDYEAEDLLLFPEGIFAFEEEKEYLLLPFQGSDGAMLCLQSVATPALAFVVMDPFLLCSGYTPELRPDELRFFGTSDTRELCFYSLCAVKNPVANSTVNLRCPIVFHPGTHKAIQVILESGSYHMRHLLSEFGGRKGADAPC